MPRSRHAASNQITAILTKWAGRDLCVEVKKDVVISVDEEVALTFLIVDEQLDRLRVLNTRRTHWSDMVK